MLHFLPSVARRPNPLRFWRSLRVLVGRRLRHSSVRSAPRLVVLGAAGLGGVVTCVSTESTQSSCKASLASPLETIPRRIKAWISSQDPVMLSIFGANTLVFLAWRLPALHPFMYANFTSSTSGMLSGRLHTLVTSAFSHESPFHFGLNMYALSMFAPPVVYAMGQTQFLQFYLGTAVASSLAAHALTVVQYSVKRQPAMLAIPGLGASGCMFGVIAIWVALFPEMKIQPMFLPALATEARTMFPIAVGLDSLGALYGFVGQSPLGHGAHLGGAACGYLLYHHYLKKYNKKIIAYERRRGYRA